MVYLIYYQEGKFIACLGNIINQPNIDFKCIWMENATEYCSMGVSENMTGDIVNRKSANENEQCCNKGISIIKYDGLTTVLCLG